MRELSYNSKALFFVKAVATVLGLKSADISHSAGYSQSSYINWSNRIYKNYNDTTAADCYIRAIDALYAERYFASSKAEVATMCGIFSLFVSYMRMYYNWEEKYMSDDYLQEGLHQIISPFLHTDKTLYETVKNYIFS